MRIDIGNQYWDCRFVLSSKFCSFTCFDHTSNIFSLFLFTVCLCGETIADRFHYIIPLDRVTETIEDKIGSWIGGKEVAAVKQISSFTFSFTVLFPSLRFGTALPILAYFCFGSIKPQKDHKADTNLIVFCQILIWGHCPVAWSRDPEFFFEIMGPPTPLVGG